MEGGLRRGGARHVLQQDGLAQDRPVVDAAAPVAVPARAHLQIKGAVHLVLLGAKDLGEMLRHRSPLERDCGGFQVPDQDQAHERVGWVAREERRQGKRGVQRFSVLPRGRKSHNLPVFLRCGAR